MKVFDNTPSQLYVVIFLPLLILRFFPQLFFWKTSKCRNLIDSDLRTEAGNYHIWILPFLWAIRFNPYFVSLFYYRIGWTRAFICSLTKHDVSTLNITCGRIGSVNMFHPFSTVLNAQSIGENFTFRNNTTIGNIDDDNAKRPVIGDNVSLGANVTIIGDIKIGNNVIVGAGSVINKDVPDNAVVVGNPFRIVRFQ